MPCPHCAATATTEQSRRTALDYPTFRCRACGRLYNERTGTPYNYLQYPTDVVLLVVLWRLRYKLGCVRYGTTVVAQGCRGRREADPASDQAAASSAMTTAHRSRWRSRCSG